MNQPITSLSDLYSREELVELCRCNALLHQESSSNDALQELGAAWALLKAGCLYEVDDFSEGAMTVEIKFAGFQFQEDPAPENLEKKLIELSFTSPPSPSNLEQLGDDTTYPRNLLLELCEKAIVPQDKWQDRDTPHTQQEIGALWSSLLAGRRYTIAARTHTAEQGDEIITDDFTIWIRLAELIDSAGAKCLFRLPTLKTLEIYAGGEWH